MKMLQDEASNFALSWDILWCKLVAEEEEDILQLWGFYLGERLESIHQQPEHIMIPGV